MAGPTAKQVRDLRAKHGMTQVDFAAKLSVTDRTVQRWEAGASPMSRATYVLAMITLGDVDVTMSKSKPKSEPTKSERIARLKSLAKIHIKSM